MTKRQISGTFVSLSLIVAMGLSILTSVSASPLPEPTANVAMVDNAFQPQTVTVQAGTTVIWTNNGTLPHTSTSDNAIWDSGLKPPGQNYSRTFDTPGTFAYHCTLHQTLGMVGTVIVQAAQATATATATPAAATTVAPTATPAPPAATPAPPTATPVTPAATPARSAPAAAPTATPTAAPPPATPAPTSTPPAKPAATPTQTPAAAAALPRTGDSNLPPLALLLAGSVLVIGLALRTATSD